MILIDSVYVNNGGGKVLLDLLVNEVNNNDLDVQFLFDDRLSNDYKSQKFSNKPIYIKAGVISRLQFYKQNLNTYNLIFTFGNVPPPIKMNIPVYTYLHNVLYLEDKKYLNFVNYVHISLKEFYINLVKKNTDYWIVQSNLVKKKLAKKWDLPTNSIFSIPFYKKNKVINILPKNNSIVKYLYVSNGENYKNHKRLFKAFQKFSYQKSNVELLVTISKDYKELLSLIGKYNKQGIKIINLGILNKYEIQSIYSTVNIAIFPSLLESFGLGLIEAAEFSLPIIASNCDYVNEVVIPSKVFNPLSTLSILEVLEYSYNQNLSASKLIVENRINEIIEILKFNTNE